jgi:ABC-type transport system involved in cytochrome bd biosynthesis fused ATPase/permease subunit
VFRNGSGKSALLSALNGEMINISQNQNSFCRINGSLSLCPSIPWIQNATLKENILFNSSFNAHEFRKTIKVCALKQDLKALANKEHTEIGERGINLSGKLQYF